MRKTISILIFTVLSLSVSAQTSYEWFSKGKGNFNMGNYAMAIDCYNQVMEMEPNSWDALYHRGYSFLMKRDYENAIADFTEVLKHREDDEWAYISRGSAYNKLQQYEKALADFNHAITINGDNADAYNNRGWSKKFLGDKIGACNDWHTSKQLGNQEAKIILVNNHCKKKKKKR